MTTQASAQQQQQQQQAQTADHVLVTRRIPCSGGCGVESIAKRKGLEVRHLNGELAFYGPADVLHQTTAVLSELRSTMRADADVSGAHQQYFPSLHGTKKLAEQWILYPHHTRVVDDLQPRRPRRNIPGRTLCDLPKLAIGLAVLFFSGSIYLLASAYAQGDTATAETVTRFSRIISGWSWIPAWQ
jgi:hypothetical protein